MKIENIIYETTREIYSLEDKLRIGTIFIFCYKVSSVKFAELLYCKNHEKFIEQINQEYKDYDVDFYINLNDKNINNSFYKTLSKVTDKYDDNGYFKALFNKDPFAMVISEIVNYNFNDIDLKKITKQLSYQLSLF